MKHGYRDGAHTLLSNMSNRGKMGAHTDHKSPAREGADAVPEYPIARIERDIRLDGTPVSTKGP